MKTSTDTDTAATPADTAAALAKFAAADVRSARRNGFIIVCEMKCGTVELARCEGRGMIEVDGVRMTVKAAKALLVANYIVAAE